MCIRDRVISSIRDQEKLTPELEQQIRAAATMVAVDDLYRPYRPKRRTRAMIAREKGLEPLADLIMLQNLNPVSYTHLDVYKRQREESC